MSSIRYTISNINQKVVALILQVVEPNKLPIFFLVTSISICNSIKLILMIVYLFLWNILNFSIFFTNLIKRKN